MITGAVLDTYLHHAQPHQPGLDVRLGENQVGHFTTLLREVNDLEYESALNGANALIDMQIEAKITEIREIFLNFPDPTELNMITLSCDHDTFLEVLMSNVKNAIVSFQSWSSKLSSLKKGALISRINLLKDDFLINVNEINILERELNDLVEG